VPVQWFEKLKQGLKKTAQIVGSNIKSVWNEGEKGAKLTEEQWEKIEDFLIQGDVGAENSHKWIQSLKNKTFSGERDFFRSLAQEIETCLAPFSRPFSWQPSPSTQVVLLAGVNGCGKTTSIAKLTRLCQDQGATKIEWAACDTFRAAAVDQLKEWSQRLHIPLYDTYPGQKDKVHASSLAFYALEQAQKKETELLFIDTAGRLQNNDPLMKEIEKIIRVLKKMDPDSPHHCLLVIDGTTGQNAFSQVEHFRKILPLTGLVVTKLDSSSKAGFLVHLTQKFQIPIAAVGVGEHVDDMNSFDAQAFTKSLLGV
jgi:fused signal recognition particle receptor